MLFYVFATGCPHWAFKQIGLLYGSFLRLGMVEIGSSGTGLRFFFTVIELPSLLQLMSGSLSEMRASQLNCFFWHLVQKVLSVKSFEFLLFYPIAYLQSFSCRQRTCLRQHESDLHQSACQLASNDGGGHAVCFCLSKKIIFGAYNVNFYFTEHLLRLIKTLGVFFYFV